MLIDDVICYKVKQKLANIVIDEKMYKFLILKYWGIQEREIKYKLKICPK